MDKPEIIREIRTTLNSGTRYLNQQKLLIDPSGDEHLTVDQLVAKLQDLQEWGRGGWSISIVEYGDGLAAVSPIEYIYKAEDSK